MVKTAPLLPLDKQRIANSFQASAASYEAHALVQKEIGCRLIDILRSLDTIDYARVLEIGCCTGILTEMLAGRRHIDTLFVNDIVQEFCATTAKRVTGLVDRIECLPGDIERCALPGNLGLVLSSATLQWMSDLPALFRKIEGALAVDGYLVFSIFGPGTMGEIGTLTGRSLPYHSREELGDMMQEYFHIVSLASDRRQLFFPSVRGVLQHIRKTGVGGLGGGGWLPGRYKEFERQYRSRFATASGIPVTYVSTFVVAKKK